MTSESDKGGGEGSGLPVGVEWETYERGGAAYLFGPIAGERIAIATAFPNGGWRAGISSRHNVAQSRPGEHPRAAAQREAEAALWACDGYGTGEVRGLRLPLLDISDAAALVASRQTVALPGLSGWWIVRAARCDGGADGIEVDAVRAPVVEPPRRPRPMPPVAPRARRGEGDEEDEPDPCAKHDATGSNIGWQSWCPGCNVALHSEPAPREPSAPTDPSVTCPVHWFGFRRELDPGHASEHAAGYVQTDGDTGRVTWEGGSIPREEPSAHTDGAELARLLPGLLDYCAAVLAEPDEDTRSRLGVGKRLALACSLLLGERERVAATLQALFSDVATPIELATHTTELLEEAARETDKLRARVAELEAVIHAHVIDDDLVKADRDAIGRLSFIATMGGSVESAYLREVRRVRERAAKRAEEAERVKTERRIAILTQTADAGEIAVGALERLRTRAEEAERKLADVAALQTSTAADLDAARAQLRLVAAGPDDVWCWQGDGHDDPASLACPVVMSAETLREFVAARARVAELEALLHALRGELVDMRAERDRFIAMSRKLEAERDALAERLDALAASPPPHTVAALLAALDAHSFHVRRQESAASDDGSRRQLRGERAGIDEAARLITATLGAPSPLDRAVGEVCALLASDVIPSTVETIGDHAMVARGYLADISGHVAHKRRLFAMAARVLLAGMLACDAAKGGPRG